MNQFDLVIKKLSGFLELKPGWFYRSGKSISVETIQKAIIFLFRAKSLGYDDFDAVPGTNGEVQMVAYSGDFRFESTIESSGVASILFEKNGDEICDSQHLDFETSLVLFEQLSVFLCAGSGISKEVSTSNEKIVLVPSPLRTAKEVVSLSSTRIASIEMAEPSVSTSAISIPIILTSPRSFGYSTSQSFQRNGILFGIPLTATPAITTFSR